MKYKKQSIKCYKVLNMYPVYIEGVYEGHEPFKVVGVRENQVELEGDFSGGTHNVCQKDWFDDDRVFVVKTVCDEQLKPNGCQIHNVNCCGGGSVINKHVSYWDALEHIDEQITNKTMKLISQRNNSYTVEIKSDDGEKVRLKYFRLGEGLIPDYDRFTLPYGCSPLRVDADARQLIKPMWRRFNN